MQIAESFAGKEYRDIPLELVIQTSKCLIYLVDHLTNDSFHARGVLRIWLFFVDCLFIESTEMKEKIKGKQMMREKIEWNSTKNKEMGSSCIIPRNFPFWIVDKFIFYSAMEN